MKKKLVVVQILKCRQRGFSHNFPLIFFCICDFKNFLHQNKPASQVRVSNGVSASLLPVQLPADTPAEAAENGLRAWASPSHLGDPDG